MSAAAAIRSLDLAGAEAALPDLAALLVDAVAGGASVNFLAGYGQEEALAFWRGQLGLVASGGRIILVAEAGNRLVGTVTVTLAPQPNAPHRAEIGKMLVHSAARRLGLGRRLLAAAEEAAARHGRTLLILDTEAGSAGDRLYRSGGWTPFGTVPGYALTTDGRPAAATFFYKDIGGRAP